MKHRLIVLGLLAAPVVAAAQIGTSPIPPSWDQHPGASPTPRVHGSQSTEDPADRMRREQLDKLTLKRQLQARADAARLLTLATELKAQLDAGGANTTSAKSFGNTDEIIKLAKSIKNNNRPL